MAEIPNMTPHHCNSPQKDIALTKYTGISCIIFPNMDTIHFVNNKIILRTNCSVGGKTCIQNGTTVIYFLYQGNVVFCTFKSYVDTTWTPFANGAKSPDGGHSKVSDVKELTVQST